MRASCRRSWASAVVDVRLRLAAAVLSAACVSAAAEQAPARTVVIDAMKFSPPTLTVRRGERVVWINKDLVPHTATAAKSFDSGTLAAGASWSHVVDKTGRHDYVCTLHPSMKGTLVVVD
jgi:plastocyanin